MSKSEHVPSYYAASAHAAPKLPELEGEIRADVAIVGAGYTGLSAALELASRGYEVAVLEAHRVGWGASGRNGGQICTGFSAGLEKIEKWIGLDDARKLFAIAEEGKALIGERVKRHGIACDLKWGYLHAAPKARHVEELKWERDVAETRFGYERLDLVDRDEVHRMIASSAYVGGLYDSGAGHLHPLNYCLGLAKTAREAGARIFENSKVERLELGKPAVAVTLKGRVTADFLVLAGNAYLEGLVPQIRSKVMPVGTYIGATVPLGENRAKALIPDDIAVADTNFVLNYFRRSADHRMLFGGRVSYSTIMPPYLPRAMRHKMLHVFPQLSDVTFEYTWGGFVAITVERTPDIGRIAPNVYYAQGYSGTGVALSGIVGKILSEAIAGQAERVDLFGKLPHTRFPGGAALRTPLLAAAMLWYRLRDFL
ncbi:MAG TPA: FAD-binding oxidoreductase [Alphaproteobacteria bacterium]|nr:FAD-binding oxidoreductase [Alphaproteobacteria bacterium]